MMKPSIYNISTRNAETGETILFNTLYGSTAVIEEASMPLVKRLLSGRKIECEQPTETLGVLQRGRFLIDDNVNEIDIVRNRKVCGIGDSNRADVIVMPNLHCNFACPYCYEVHDRAHRMSSDTERSVITWLSRLFEQHKVIMLNWFGGEPLLTPKTLLSIQEFAKNKSEQQGVALTSNVTTNGYALTDTLIDKLIKVGILSYQITVDGPPTTHNATRVLKSGKATFSRVFENIVSLAEASPTVKISVRVNYNHKNIYHIPELLEMFPEHIRGQLRIVFEPIFGNSAMSATGNLPSGEISRVVSDHYAVAQSLGYDVVHGGLGIGKLVYCYAERNNQYIVNYNADIFKCSVSEFSRSKRLGFISKGGELILDDNKCDEWMSMALFAERCERCMFLPLCMGGCRKDRFENKNTGSYCHLIPTNTSQALKSVAFGSFQQMLRREVRTLRRCASNKR